MAVLVGLVLWRHVPAAQSGALRPDDTRAQASPAEASPRAASGARQLQASLTREHTGQAFEALKQRAEAGDGVAQRLLAESYADCYFVNLDREAFLGGLDERKRLASDRAQVRVLEQAARERIAQCDAVNRGTPLELELAARWYAEAARNGDLAARTMVRAHDLRRHDPIVTAQLLEEVLASGDPAAVFYFGNTLRVDDAANPGEPTEALATGEMATWAWMVAGCRMGYDCGPTGRVMVGFCLEGNGCTGEDAETYVRRELPTDAERAELDRRVGEILGLVEGQ
ncbi:hypothetical protein [uncultured Stenotrophomonas sp.]|uniref:hypothetical protein n=1 Tax=uncultured Stenotrophomonas sp. TaxID=165438 RepID=UPI0028E52119|nr:hypothetical protein [uncultured Stenotrophomonas sp.]